jgi:hypothetical protein
MNYIKKLESRIDNLEKQNNELKAEVWRQNKHSGVSAKAAARLSAATPEFKPTGPSTSSSSSSSSSVSQQYCSPATNGSRNHTRSSATDNGNGSGGRHGSPGSSSSLTKMHERLATLEGRQSSMQKKIACFDHVFGPSVGNWQRNVKEFLQKHVDYEGGEVTRRSVSPILVHADDDASAAGTKTEARTDSSSSSHTTEETNSEEK